MTDSCRNLKLETCIGESNSFFFFYWILLSSFRSDPICLWGIESTVWQLKTRLSMVSPTWLNIKWWSTSNDIYGAAWSPGYCLHNHLSSGRVLKAQISWANSGCAGGFVALWHKLSISLGVSESLHGGWCFNVFIWQICLRHWKKWIKHLCHSVLLCLYCVTEIKLCQNNYLYDFINCANRGGFDTKTNHATGLHVCSAEYTQTKLLLDIPNCMLFV